MILIRSLISLKPMKPSIRRPFLSPAMKLSNYRGILSHQTWKLSSQRPPLSSEMKTIQSEASSFISTWKTIQSEASFLLSTWKLSVRDLSPAMKIFNFRGLLSHRLENDPIRASSLISPMEIIQSEASSLLDTWKLSNRRPFLSPAMKLSNFKGLLSHQAWKLSNQRPHLSSRYRSSKTKTYRNFL